MIISRKKVWLIPALLLLILAIALMIYGVLSTQWIHVDCDQRGIELGMWRMCVNAPEETGEASHHNQHQVWNFTEEAELCKIILLGMATNIPQWLASIQLLTLFGIGAVVVTTIMATLYLFAKSNEQLAIGIAAVCFCSGTFVFIALFNTASHMYIHNEQDTKNVAINELIVTVFNVTCEEFSDTSSIALTLLWAALACIFLAGGLAIAASCCLESGLGQISHQTHVGYNTAREDLLYSLVEDNDAFLDTSDEESCPTPYNVSRQESFTIGHETGTSKSTA